MRDTLENSHPDDFNVDFLLMYLSLGSTAMVVARGDSF